MFRILRVGQGKDFFVTCHWSTGRNFSCQLLRTRWWCFYVAICGLPLERKLTHEQSSITVTVLRNSCWMRQQLIVKYI